MQGGPVVRSKRQSSLARSQLPGVFVEATVWPWLVEIAQGLDDLHAEGAKVCRLIQMHKQVLAIDVYLADRLATANFCEPGEVSQVFMYQAS